MFLSLYRSIYHQFTSTIQSINFSSTTLFSVASYMIIFYYNLIHATVISWHQNYWLFFPSYSLGLFPHYGIEYKNVPSGVATLFTLLQLYHHTPFDVYIINKYCDNHSSSNQMIFSCAVKFSTIFGGTNHSV